jgi:cob(I)alamin adenosyltransferase
VPITTQRGDQGLTDLLFGARVSKTHPRVIACGDVDELNATLGLVRVSAKDSPLDSWLATRQQELFTLMGELAVLPEDHERYQGSNIAKLTTAHVETLTHESLALETSLQQQFRDWALPGDTVSATSAALDLARTLCRRAERAVWAISPAPLTPAHYLNRLSDLLWLHARSAALTHA